MKGKIKIIIEHKDDQINKKKTTDDRDDNENVNEK